MCIHHNRVERERDSVFVKFFRDTQPLIAPDRCTLSGVRVACLDVILGNKSLSTPVPIGIYAHESLPRQLSRVMPVVMRKADFTSSISSRGLCPGSVA